jgi:hypothetical protein
VKIHAILLPLVTASAASLAGAIWDRGLRWEMRILLGELAVLFILFPVAFYGGIYSLRFRWWLRNQRGMCGACGRNPTTGTLGGLCAQCVRSAIEPYEPASLWINRRRRPVTSAGDDVIGATPMNDREADREVLAHLAGHGADLSKRVHAMHYLYFGSRRSARAAANELHGAGYPVCRLAREPARTLWERVFGPRRYSCIVETRAVPSEAHVLEATDRMTALVQRLGGEYDGWDAEVER